MLEPKALARFALFSAVFYTLLMWPWAARDQAYAAAFRAAGDAVFSRFWFWPEGIASFLDLQSPTLRKDMEAVVGGRLPASVTTPTPADIVQDTLVVLKNKNVPGSVGFLRTSSRPIGYWPAAALVAVTLATPMHGRRKLAALVMGLFQVHLFIVLRISLFLLHGGFGQPDKKYRLVELSPTLQSWIGRLNEVFMENPSVSYIVPIFVWLFTAFLIHTWCARSERRREKAEGLPAHSGRSARA